MVQPRIARMTRIMVCAFVQISVIRGCLNYIINSADAGISNAVFYSRNVSGNGIYFLIPIKYPVYDVTATWL